MLLQDDHWAVQHEVMQSYVAYARSSASEDIRDVIPRGLLPGALLLAPVHAEGCASSVTRVHTLTEYALSRLWQLLVLPYADMVSTSHFGMAVVGSSLPKMLLCRPTIAHD